MQAETKRGRKILKLLNQMRRIDNDEVVAIEWSSMKRTLQHTHTHTNNIFGYIFLGKCAYLDLHSSEDPRNIVFLDFLLMYIIDMNFPMLKLKCCYGS